MECKEQLWKRVLEQWGSEQGSDCHVATSPRRDVSTSRRLHVATSPRRDVSTLRRLHVVTLQHHDVSSRSAPYHLKYEWFRNQGIGRRTNEGMEFQSRVTQTSRKCPGFVLSFIAWIFSDKRMMFLLLHTFIVSFIMF